MGLMAYARAQWDRAGAVLLVVLGLLSLLLGWLGVSGTEHVAGQLPYIVSGGLLGIFLLGVAAVLWLSADLRDEWRELKSLNLALREEHARRRAQERAQAPTAEEPAFEAPTAAPRAVAARRREPRSSTSTRSLARG